MIRSELRQKLAHRTGTALGVGSILWLYWLIRGAIALRDQTGATHYDISIGSIVLNQLSKRIVDGGYAVEFSFEYGMLWYLTVCCMLGLAWGSVSYYRHMRSRPPEE